MKIRHRTWLAMGFGVILGGLSSQSVLAQDGADDGLLDVITVTARKREESLLEVPVAITAFGRDDIENLGLESVQDLQYFTPGFVFETFATTTGRFDQSSRFRGIEGSLTETVSARLSAEYHMDGGHYQNQIVPGEKLGEEKTNRNI